MLRETEWGEYRLGDLFSIEHTLSFNAEALNEGEEYDYVTRTSTNQGILRETGFVNEDNINSAGNWSLGLLQMDFFYRAKPWYAGQFVRKVVPKIEIPDHAISFMSTVLNKQKQKLLSVLVRDVDDTFRNSLVVLPTKNKAINFSFMEKFIAELEAQRIAELEAQRIAELEAYLCATGLKNYELTRAEWQALDDFKEGRVSFDAVPYRKIFSKIKQGRRLKKADQSPGTIPFIMSGTTNTGVVNYVSNPVASFPANSITLDIFGNAFYRGYVFGAGDDTGVYWNDAREYSKEMMLFLTAAMEKSVAGKFSYGKKLRSAQSLDICMQIPVREGTPDFAFMERFISAVQKLVIRDVVDFADRKISAVKTVTGKAEPQGVASERRASYYEEPLLPFDAVAEAETE